MSKKSKKEEKFAGEPAGKDISGEHGFAEDEHGSAEAVERPCEPTDGKQAKQTAEAASDKTVPDIEAELEDLKQRLQRLGADYQNYQKRAQKQIEQAMQYACENMVKSLLPVFDNFERALEKGGQEQSAEALLQGVQIVYDHLSGVLESGGLRRIEVNPGCPFNPAIHEAMLHEPSEEFDENTVLRELARGYVMNGRTLQPAKVSVVRTPPAVDLESDKQDQDTNIASE
jgi:molecular chaperone GrpE